MAVIGFEKYSNGEWFVRDNFSLMGSSFTGKVLDFTKYFPVAGRTIVYVTKEKVDDVISGHSMRIDLSDEGDYPAEYVISKLSSTDKELSDYLRAPTYPGKIVCMEPEKDIFVPIFKHHIQDLQPGKDNYTFHVPYKMVFKTKLYSQSQDEIGTLQVIFVLENGRRKYYISCDSAVRDISENIFGRSFGGIILPNFMASVQETNYEFKDTVRLVNETSPSLHNSNHASICRVSKKEGSGAVLDVDYGVPLHVSLHIKDTYIFGPFEQHQTDRLKGLLNWAPQLMERNHEFFYNPK